MTRLFLEQISETRTSSGTGGWVNIHYWPTAQWCFAVGASAGLIASPKESGSHIHAFHLLSLK